MEPLVWSIVLLIVALALVVLELFVPSGGVLGFLAAAAAVACVVVAFTGGPRLGFVMLLAVTVLVPVVLVTAVQWWPHTPIGRLVLNAPPENPDDVLPDSEEYRGLRPLIGRTGKAESKMLPSGAVLIDGRSYDAVSEGTPIDKGELVKVVDVRTNRIVVRSLGETASSGSPGEPEPARDVLSQPVESLGLDGFDEPLA